MHWGIKFLPIVIVLVVVNILFMLHDVKKGESLGGSKEYFIQEYKKMPPMTIIAYLLLTYWPAFSLS